jgi:hypothetical protein
MRRRVLSSVGLATFLRRRSKAAVGKHGSISVALKREGPQVKGIAKSCNGTFSPAV